MAGFVAYRVWSCPGCRCYMVRHITAVLGYHWVWVPYTLPGHTANTDLCKSKPLPVERPAILAAWILGGDELVMVPWDTIPGDLDHMLWELPS